MRKTFPLIGITTVSMILAGCSQSVQGNTLESLLRNPLFAEQYSEQMVDTLTELEINQDVLLQNESKKKEVLGLKNQWLDTARNARKDQREGLLGGFVPVHAFIEGEVLLSGRTVHLSPQFVSVPGPSLHLYLTPAVDPRDVKFPDPSAADLGVLPSPYGTQSIELPADAGEALLFRSVVLWDTTLEKIYGFAQLSPQ
ncbi:hypothetical protein FJZ28_02905 [Candidatus Peregrinibacteria bacterium]|nr:hypothetical protein [Candidatus Peregrinibacteria bacterium]